MNAAEEVRGLVQFAFLRRPLAQLLCACEDAALDLIVLKGAALAETVYPRPSLRPFGDIDVLVRAQDTHHVQTVLSDLGYVADADAWADLISGRSGEVNFFRDTALGPVVVELHTDLLNNSLLRPGVSLDQAGLWQRSRPACLAGENARVLGPEDQVLHLCLHLAGHYFDAPRSVRDLVQVCAVQRLDWPLFVCLCRASRAEAIGWCGLLAAAQNGADVPPFVLKALAPRHGQRLLKKLLAARVQGGGEEATRFLLLWLLLGSAWARFHAVCRLLFPSRAWLRAHYAFDLTETALSRRPPLGILLFVKHLQFLAAALCKLGRKSRHQA